MLVPFPKGTYKVDSIGDIDPGEYDGGYVTVQVADDQTATAWVEMVVWHEGKEEYYGILNRVPIPADVWKEFNWVTKKDVATCCGIDADPENSWWWEGGHTLLQRARIITDIAGYYGWRELDHYPMGINRATDLWKNMVPIPDELLKLLEG